MFETTQLCGPIEQQILQHENYPEQLSNKFNMKINGSRRVKSLKILVSKFNQSLRFKIMALRRMRRPGLMGVLTFIFARQLYAIYTGAYGVKRYAE